MPRHTVPPEDCALLDANCRADRRYISRERLMARSHSGTRHLG